MNWSFRIRKDVPSWVLKFVLIVAIVLIAGLQYLNLLWKSQGKTSPLQGGDTADDFLHIQPT